MSGERLAVVLNYPGHQFEPEDLLHFIETKPFSRAWQSLGLPDEDLARLQVALMVQPKGWPVVQGTGGLRKMRFSPQGWPSGKSGALRVCYVFFDEFKIIILTHVYRKNERDDLSHEHKVAIKELIERQRLAFSKGTYA